MHTLVFHQLLNKMDYQTSHKNSNNLFSCFTCSVLQLDRIKTNENGVKLSIRLEPISDQNPNFKTFQKVKKELLFLLGNGIQVKSINEAVNKLFLRNFPELNFYKGTEKEVNIQIFIPEFYLTTAKKYIEPSRGPEVLQNCKQVKEKCSEIRDKRGMESFEKHEKTMIGAKRQFHVYKSKY